MNSSRKPTIPAKNARLATFEELALVKGFTGEVLLQIRPYTTVYGENRVAAPININTAPKKILVALDDAISDSLAEQIMNYRRSTPFTNKGELGNVPGMKVIATGLQLRITVKSNVFRIRAEAQVNGTTRVVESVVSFAQGALSTLYWREY
ncbi:MAG: ral secretion pathway protein [Deltaproteobacteria bacterium]|nr:ral secretion pathway protein [Deltaproteobacteria bacterium]